MRYLLLIGAATAALAQSTASIGVPASSFADSPAGTSSSNAWQPITAKQRVRWVVESSVGPVSLAAGLFSAGWGTAFNSPREYGTHWDGFGQRYGMRLTGIATSNVIEAGLGSLWGEDPRYRPALGAPFGTRVGHIVKMTFLATNRNGGTMPAYARYAAIAGNNFLSNTWRADSEATTDRAMIRIGLGFLGRMGGNTFAEFWPDVTSHLFHRNAAPPPPPVQRTVGSD